MAFNPPYDVPEERLAYTFLAKQDADYGRIGCLLLHGFMGSPASTRPMAQWLAQQGITCHCPLLPGHGHLPYQIHGYTLREWLQEAEEGLQTLRQWADQIFIVGHSMGAVLAAHLAHIHTDIHGLILLAPLYDVPDKRIKLAWLGKYVMPYFRPLKRKDVDREVFVGRVLDFDPTIDVDDPSLQDWLVEASRIPLSAVAEMVRAAKKGRKLWHKLHLPILIMQGGKDPAVNPGNAEKVFSLLPTGDKEMKLFPNVGHELMRPFEPIHSTVWNLLHQFIKTHAEPVTQQDKFAERSRQSLRL